MPLKRLKKYYGYDAFRPGQAEIIEAILSGKDTLAIMPTGGGKSICFQIPAMIMPGLTLVISPLIALMKDQVDGLVENGIQATFINSTLDPAEQLDRFARMREGQYQMVYVAPEGLQNYGLKAALQDLKVSMVAIDEAHCISQWGHDFRPSYLAIPAFIRDLNQRPVISAFTATATKRISEDIVTLMGLNQPVRYVGGVDRHNLIYRVEKPAKKAAYVLNYLSNLPDHTSGIVYCATRKSVDGLTTELKKKGIRAAAYHAGLASDVRTKVQDAYMLDKLQVVVATNAFGMGIDKPDVRFVIHYNMPKNMEAYYQEAGRAGRDGLMSDCILLYDASDIIKQKMLISMGTEDPTRFKIGMENLQSLINYCHTNKCLRHEIAHYFDVPLSGEGCGSCGNCLDVSEEVDVSEPAQKILSCIYRTGQRFGMTTIVQVLRGSKQKKIIEWKLDQVSTYGLLKDLSEPLIKEIIMYLIAKGYVHMTQDGYPVMKLDESSRAVLKGDERVYLKQTRVAQAKPNKAKKTKSTAKTPVNDSLYECLHALRKKIAEEKNVPSYVVFSNASLEDMASLIPLTDQAFLAIKGVGEKKLKTYGPVFMAAIKKHMQEIG